MLKTQKVGEYTVTEAGALQDLLQVRLQSDQKIDDFIAAQADEMTRLLMQSYRHYYPLIASVTVPFITFDAFFQIPKTELDELHAAASALNPFWFESDAEKKSG